VVLFNADSLGILRMARFTVTTIERKKNEKCQVNELFSTYIHFESCTVNTSNYIFTYFVYLFFYTFTLEVYSYIILLLHLFVFLLFEIFNVHHNNIVTKATLGCLNRGNQFITMPSQFSPIVQFCDSSAV
jgi:hypothetical protein